MTAGKKIKNNMTSKADKAIPANKRPPLQRSFSTGSKYSLVDQGECQVCRIGHQKNLLQKIIFSKPLRKWESHKILLSDSHITSSTLLICCVFVILWPAPRGYMTYGVSYSEIGEVVRNNKPPYTVHFVLPKFGSLILQLNSAYERDRWYFSIFWKITAARLRNLSSKIKRPDELLSELKELVSICLATPISDNCAYQLPMNSISSLLLLHGHEIKESLKADIIKVIVPLLEMTSLPPSMCKCFQRITKNQANMDIVEAFFTAVEKILKHNTDFGRYPHLRVFVQDFLCGLHSNSAEHVLNFIQNLHTANSTCPHPRVLPNLVTVSLAAVYSAYEEEVGGQDQTRIMACFAVVFKTMYSFKDWTPTLSCLLQAVPFPQGALADEDFQKSLADMITTFAASEQCEVHQSILPIREEKDGWVNHFAPGGLCCHDEGELFSSLMSHLVACCCKRKKMLIQLRTDKMMNLFTLMAIRGDKHCSEVLVAILDFDLMEDEEKNMEIVSALQSSEEGRRQYDKLCSKRDEFKNMREKGGPYKLTLPSKSTDADLEHVLKAGSFGNLRSLNLSFTSVTSESAKYIIQLPSLVNLNLWATEFDDRGLILISEHLPNLRSLNLCETTVTDEGLMALCFLKNLQTLNLNSTKLSALVYEQLKENLSELKVVDLRYTEVF